MTYFGIYLTYITSYDSNRVHRVFFFTYMYINYIQVRMLHLCMVEFACVFIVLHLMSVETFPTHAVIRNGSQNLT